MARSLAIIGLSALAFSASLTACSATTPPEPAAPPMPSEEDIASGKTCGADQLGDYIGQPASDDVIAAIQAWRGDKAVRVLRPGSVMTMDFRPDRLNINVDKDGRITSFKCT